jgi:hypothetical protein
MDFQSGDAAQARGSGTYHNLHNDYGCTPGFACLAHVRSTVSPSEVSTRTFEHSFSGDLHQISQGQPFLTFEDWSRKGGSIVGFKLGSQNAVVLHDAADVHELIVKHGAVASARPPRYVAQEHVIPEGKHVHTVFMCNDYVIRLRTIKKNYLINPGLLKLSPMAQAIGMRLVWDIYRSNGDWTDDLARWAVTKPTAVLAGAPVEARGREFVHDYHEMLVIFEEIMVSSDADINPVLRWVRRMF